MHDNSGMNMGGYYFGGMHVFWWIFIIVIVIGITFMLTRSRRRK